MATKKLFASKDAVLYSDYPYENSGLDAILELSKETSILSDGSIPITRFVIKFDESEISESFSYVGTSSYKCYLNLYAADIQGIPSDLILKCHPLAQSWYMGTGRHSNIPQTIDGVCWNYRNDSTSSIWQKSGSYSTGVTSSYITGNEGGGSWYTSSYSTQSYSVYQNKDISFDVTSIINQYRSGSIVNNGFIVKNEDIIERDDNKIFKLTYFSRDTNTIYPPTLEFRWNDSRNINVTSSTITNQDVRISLSNNIMIYEKDVIYRFRIDVRDMFPTRVFSTSSIYLSKKYLPEESYYCIKDLKTDIIITPFCEFTKISSDSTSNYFDIHMDGLEPERWYKILIKSKINNNVSIYDNNYNFKVKK